MTQATAVWEALGARTPNIEHYVPAAALSQSYQRRRLCVCMWLAWWAILLFLSCCKLHWVVIQAFSFRPCLVLYEVSFAAVHHSSCVLTRSVQVLLSGGAEPVPTRFGAPVGALLACCGLRDDLVVIMWVMLCQRLLMYAVALLVLPHLASRSGLR